MPAQIESKATFDDMEAEIDYTRAALEADPDASDLLPVTEGWMALVEAARTAARTARTAEARADARRRVANLRLDAACIAFGDELLPAVNKDRSSARWRRFLPGVIATMSAFVRQPLADQVGRVRVWLGVRDDEVLGRHREALETWAGAADAALAATHATAEARGAAVIARERAAEDLTRARDGLHAMLVQRASERGLSRDWPGAFFRVERSSRRAAPADSGDSGE